MDSPPDISELRKNDKDLDRRLREMEDENRRVIAKFGWENACFGVWIAHEGVVALQRTRPGTTVQRCSRGEEGCRGRDTPHVTGNQSCRVILDFCPWCDR